MPRHVPGFVTVGEAANSALQAILIAALEAALPQLEAELENRQFSQLSPEHEYIAPLAAVVKQVRDALAAVA